MDKSKIIREVVGKFLEQLGGKIRSGECGLSDEEMLSLMSMAIHEKWYMPKLEKEFHASARTIERMCSDGRLPKLHTDDHNRKYLWHDEVELHLLSRKLQDKEADN